MKYRWRWSHRTLYKK